MAITERVDKDNYTIVRTGDSNKVWQFSMWIRAENKQYRQSLRTNHIELAEEKAEDLYYEIRHKLQNNKRVFSPSCKSAVEMYVRHRENDVKNKYITAERLSCIKGQLNHFLNYIHKDTVLTDLHRKSMSSYHRRRKAKAKTVSNSTLLNEQATINALIKWLWREGYMHFDSFDFEKILPERNLDNARRNNFTDEEYNLIVDELKNLAWKKNNVADEEEYIWNNMFKNFILILANTGMRVGELLQLRWCDVETETIMYEGKKERIAVVMVRAETSKWRKDRTFRARNGNYFDRIKKYSKYTKKTDYVFQNDVEEYNHKLVLTRFRRKFNKVLQKLEIYQLPTRKLDMYSLRHFFVTKRVDRGVLLQDLANMIGTSVIQIEKHYYHTNKNKQIETALL